MKSDMENNEWAGEEMSLLRFTKNNPFTVPAGYFDEAAQRISSLVKLDELKGTDEANGFTLPDDYFEDMAAKIISRINIEAIAGEGRDAFKVPDGYFTQLTDNIQSRVNIEAALNTQETGFAVPEGYFDSLQQQITSRVFVEEALEQNTEAFTVPEGYFEQLNKSIVNKTVNQDAVLRKTIVRKLFASNTFKYATAACLALIVGTGVFLNDTPSAPAVHTQTYLHTQLSQIPVNEIKDYLELHVDGNDTRALMENDKQINTQELDEDLQDYIDMN
jgi:hypothetical protein